MGIFGDHSRWRFCKFDILQLYESKKYDLLRAQDVDQRIRSRPGRAYVTL